MTDQTNANHDTPPQGEAPAEMEAAADTETVTDPEATGETETAPDREATADVEATEVQEMEELNPTGVVPNENAQGTGPADGPEPHGPDAPPDNAERAEDEESQRTPSNTKLVVSLNGTRATIGVKRGDTDPFLEAFYEMDCMETVLQQASGTLQRAERYWESNPRHPKTTKPRKAKRGRDTGTAAVRHNPQTDTTVERADHSPGEEPAQTLQASLF